MQSNTYLAPSNCLRIMQLKAFKSSSEKADIEFTHAYEKGVNLGREKWPVAVESFSEASKHYMEAGNAQKSSEAYALSTLFYALSSRTPDAWMQCNQAMSQLGNTQLNVGFPADSSDIEKQSLVVAGELAMVNQLNAQSVGQDKVTRLRDLAQKYLELIGTDLVIWKLMGQAIDPQRRAYYLLGLASLVEANSIIYTDPKKSASLLSDAVAQLDLAGEDLNNVRPAALIERENATKIGKCWFCGREVQGLNFHYVALKADITGYLRARYSSETPTTMDGQRVMACSACYSSVKYVSDEVAQVYYQKALQEISAVAERVNALENRVRRLESRSR
jgi:hypothetical protein